MAALAKRDVDILEEGVGCRPETELRKAHLALPETCRSGWPKGHMQGGHCPGGDPQAPCRLEGHTSTTAPACCGWDRDI